MAITVNLRYTGVDGNALKFAEEMISSGTVDAIRAEEGNLRYEYYQSYDLHMTVERYTGADMPETDNQFIRH